MKVARLRAFVVAVIVLVASSAAAKDVCVESSGGILMKFFKVKTLKKPGKFTPLHGVADGECPITGTGYMDGDNVGHFDVLISCLDTANIVLRYTWSGDLTFAGSGEVDANGDGATEGARTFTVVDCRTLTFP